MESGPSMRALLGLLACAWCAIAHAQALDDPTRPPAGFRSGIGAARGPSDPEGLVLESVIISEANRSAIISGEHVKLGAKLGPSRLIKVSEAEVVLLTGNSRRTLRLFPAGYKREPGGSAAGDEAQER
jgi:hypothetical protein